MISILIIDENQAVTTLLEEALADDTHHVQTAQDSQAALKLLREHSFDLVIADVNMPKLGGFEVIIKVNSMQPRPRVIAMTGYTGSQDKEYMAGVADSLNIECLLYKPFSMSELIASVFLHEECAESVEI